MFLFLVYTYIESLKIRSTGSTKLELNLSVGFPKNSFMNKMFHQRVGKRVDMLLCNPTSQSRSVRTGYTPHKFQSFIKLVGLRKMPNNIYFFVCPMFKCASTYTKQHGFKILLASSLIGKKGLIGEGK